MSDTGLAIRFRHPNVDIPPRVARTLALADRVNAPVEYLGLQPTFEEIRVYHGIDRDWVLAPAQLDPLLNREHRFPIPQANLDHLKRLMDAGLDFPAVYLAHDVPPGAVGSVRNVPPAARSRDLTLSGTPSIITPAIAELLVPAVPAPARTLAWSARYGAAAEILLKVLAFASTTAIGIASAPLFVVPSLFSAFATGDFTDPVVFGALPFGETLDPGRPAAWFVLTSWSY